jgi:hypothetical protein
MIWQHKEEQQKQKSMNNLYRQIREEYKSKLVSMYSQQQQQDPKLASEQMEIFENQDNIDSMLAHLVGAKK